MQLTQLDCFLLVRFGAYQYFSVFLFTQKWSSELSNFPSKVHFYLFFLTNLQFQSFKTIFLRHFWMILTFILFRGILFSWIFFLFCKLFLVFPSFSDFQRTNFKRYAFQKLFLLLFLSISEMEMEFIWWSHIFHCFCLFSLNFPVIFSPLETKKFG